jgi:hypothetical protein
MALILVQVLIASGISNRQSDGPQGILYLRAQAHPVMAVQQQSARSSCSLLGLQIAGKRFSTSSFRISSASRRSCFCFRGSAARIFINWTSSY